MASPVTFAEVLDEALDLDLEARDPSGDDLRPAIRPGVRAFTAASFVFADTWSRNASTPGSQPVSTQRADVPATVQPRDDGPIPRRQRHARRAQPSVPPASVEFERVRFREVHHLTPRQRQALDAFTGLGMVIEPDFTGAQLRSAYRLLARRYHPDRHALSSPTEQDRLARTFAALADHYRCLLSVVEPRG